MNLRRRLLAALDRLGESLVARPSSAYRQRDEHADGRARNVQAASERLPSLGERAQAEASAALADALSDLEHDVAVAPDRWWV